MLQPPVILNNTPLVAFYLLDQLNILQALFGQVLIPEAVQTEFLAIDYKNRKTALEQSSWIKVAPLQNPKQMLVFDRLDEGEAAVLALAMEQDACLVIIDERRPKVRPPLAVTPYRYSGRSTPR